MSKVLVTESHLEDIADAIRSKNGLSTQYKPGEMPAAILAIPTNEFGPGDEGKVVQNSTLVAQTSKSITANGTHDTTTNDQVVVAVPNSYAAVDEGKIVKNGALVAQTARSSAITVNGTYDTTENDSVTVNVPSSGATLQTKTVTPSASQQVVQPDSGYDGLSAVTVNGDADLVAGNIKNGVEIFGVTGSYDGGGGATLLYNFNESQGDVWINTGVDVSNMTALIFEGYNANGVDKVVLKLISDIAVYTGGEDVYTNIYTQDSPMNVRIYNSLLYVSYNGTGPSTTGTDIYEYVPKTYNFNESQGHVWINTGVDVSNMTALIFEGYNANGVDKVVLKLISDIAVYTGGEDVYTTVYRQDSPMNVRIYNSLLYVSYEETGPSTTGTDVYEYVPNHQNS